MCTVSMIMDHYGDKWDERKRTPFVWPQPQTPVYLTQQITPAEIAEFRQLLDRARDYDRKHAEPDCELEEKKARVKKLAEDLGVTIDFL